MDVIAKFTPDQHHHLDEVKSWSCLRAQKAFGVSPAMVGCWRCFLGAMSEEDLKALNKVPVTVLIDLAVKHEAHDRMSTEDWFSPTPQSLLDEWRTQVSAASSGGAGSSGGARKRVRDDDE